MRLLTSPTNSTKSNRSPLISKLRQDLPKRSAFHKYLAFSLKPKLPSDDFPVSLASPLSKTDNVAATHNIVLSKHTVSSDCGVAREDRISGLSLRSRCMCDSAVEVTEHSVDSDDILRLALLYLPCRVLRLWESLRHTERREPTLAATDIGSAIRFGLHE